MILKEFAAVACISGNIAIKENTIPYNLLRFIPGSTLHTVKEYMQREVASIYQAENILVILLEK